MSAVGYEGHIWEELFGGINFKKLALAILIVIGLILIAIAYFVLK